MFEAIASASETADAAERLAPVLAEQRVRRAVGISARLVWGGQVPRDIVAEVTYSWPDDWRQAVMPALDSTRAARGEAFRNVILADEVARLRAAEVADAEGLSGLSIGEASGQPNFGRWKEARAMDPAVVLNVAAVRLSTAHALIGALPAESQGVARGGIARALASRLLTFGFEAPHILKSLNLGRTPQMFALAVLTSEGVTAENRTRVRAILQEYLSQDGDLSWKSALRAVDAANAQDVSAIGAAWQRESANLLEAVQRRLSAEAGLTWVKEGDAPRVRLDALSQQDATLIGIDRAFTRRILANQDVIRVLRGTDIAMGLPRPSTELQEQTWLAVLAPSDEQLPIIQQLFADYRVKWESAARTHVQRALSAPVAYCENEPGFKPSTTHEELIAIARAERPAARAASDTADQELAQGCAAALGPSSTAGLQLLLAGRRLSQALESCASGPISANEIQALGGAPMDVALLLDQSDADARRALLAVLAPMSSSTLTAATSLRNACWATLDASRFEDIKAEEMKRRASPPQNTAGPEDLMSWEDDLDMRARNIARARMAQAFQAWRTHEDSMSTALLSSDPRAGVTALQFGMDASRWPANFSKVVSFRRVADLLDQRAKTDSSLAATAAGFRRSVEQAMRVATAEVEPLRPRADLFNGGRDSGSNHAASRQNQSSGRSFEAWYCLNGAYWLLSKRLDTQALDELSRQVPDLKQFYAE
jgi:hypothetical protein